MKIRRKATKEELEGIECNCPKCGKLKPEDVLLEIIVEDKKKEE